MVFPKEESESESKSEKKVVQVHSLRLSSVGPSKMTGADVVHHLTPIDLAMKLHYLSGLYFFNSQAAEGLRISSIKEAMFEWLNKYYIVCGRLKRWPETGRPHIKCNDCGVRIIEAVCDNTVEEWLSSATGSDDDDDEMRKLLIYHQVIGPEISFSPPFLIQITKFKCGGMSLGLSWAHVLGDAIAAIDCINMWPQFLVGSNSVSPKASKPIPTLSKSPCPVERDPVSLKRVDPVGDHWTFNTPDHCNIKSFTFHLTHPQLNHIRLNFFKSDQTPPIFESLCALLWKLIAEAKVGDGDGDGNGNGNRTYNYNNNVVTICKNDSSRRAAAAAAAKEGGGGLSNSQKISVVEAEVVGSGPNELLGLLTAQLGDEENELIEEAVERSNGLGDFIMYGANLTFVDLWEADLYGLELNGVTPLFAHYVIQGVGREGVVVVAPGPTALKDSSSETGVVVTVTVVLPEELIPELKHKLKTNGILFRNNLI